MASKDCVGGAYGMFTLGAGNPDALMLGRMGLLTLNAAPAPRREPTGPSDAEGVRVAEAAVAFAAAALVGEC